MNDIDEFFAVALGILFGISLLLILLTYLEKSLIEPVKDKTRSNPHDSPKQRRITADVVAPAKPFLTNC
jgi:hypothetical protein